MRKNNLWLLASFGLAWIFEHRAGWKKGSLNPALALSVLLVLLLGFSSPFRSRPIFALGIIASISFVHGYLRRSFVVIALLAVGYVLSVRTFAFLVTLVTLSGSGALQLMPAVLGVCFPGRRLFTRAGVLSGMGTGLGVLYLTLVADPNPFASVLGSPHPLGLHGAVWSVLANFAVTSESAHRAFVNQMFHHLVKQSPPAYGLETAEELRWEFAHEQFNMQKLAARIAVLAASQGSAEPAPPAPPLPDPVPTTPASTE